MAQYSDLSQLAAQCAGLEVLSAIRSCGHCRQSMNRGVGWLASGTARKKPTRGLGMFSLPTQRAFQR